MARIPRTAHFLVCDDIRLEQGNKHSLMGIYGTQVFVPEMPVVLPKLCFQVQVRTPVAKPVKALQVQFTGPGKLKFEATATDDALRQAVSDIQADTEMLIYTLTLVSAPFEIREDGQMMAIAIADGRKLPAGRVKFTLAKSVKSTKTKSG